MEQKDARLAYELTIGYRISDSTWYKIKRLLTKHLLEITPENAKFFAQVRKVIPRSAIGVQGILGHYQKAEKFLASSQSLKGKEVLEILSNHGVKPHQTTISRWFAPLGGYRKNKEYSPSQLKGILTAAFIYKSQFISALPQEIHHEQIH